ncbi:MAG: hypothetical protein IJA58_05200 [Lachnospiraceae bacterium]|nr:hypothetical protein [Lachnospiraceae bacterium]
MRYFKCESSSKTENDILREQYKKLGKKEKQLFRRRNWSNRLSSGLITVVSIGAFAGCLWAIGYIQEPEQPVWLLFFLLLKIALIGCALIFSLVVCVLLSLVFGGKLELKKRAIKKELLSKACTHLREYYELQEPCLVTKCYDSSDSKFVSHDVCLFVAQEELRITTNLLHGFFHGDKDLGCYALKREEIHLSQVQQEHYMATELKAEGVAFLLGAKAKGFIEKHYLFMAES